VPTPELSCADYPANGLITTVGDHLRLLTMLAEGGDRRILRRASVDAMLRPRMPIGDLRIAPDGSWWVGLAVMLANLDAPDFHFGHPGGYMWGWWCVSRVYPRRGLAYVIAVNAWDMAGWHDPGNPDAVALIAEALAEPPRSWAWKRAYAAGVLLAAGVAACADDWDEQGFRAGVLDFLAGGTARLRVDPRRLRTLFAGLGADPPLPLMFWPQPKPQARRAAPADGRPADRSAARS
jgi:Beta-lactamase